MSVTNLGMSEQQDYKTFSGPSTAGGYCRAMNKHRPVFFDQDGSLKEVQRIKDMYGTLQEELKATCLKVEKSERSVERLLTDVQRLREMVSEKKRLRTPIPEEKQNHNLIEKNIHLCQALKKAFPNSKLLQSVSITREGQVLPVQCHNEDHRMSIKDTPTQVSTKSMHTSSSERANASGITCKRKAKNCLNRLSRGKKRRTVWPKARRSVSRDSEGSETDSVNRLSGSENEGNVLDQYSNDIAPSASPTF
ncbi:BRCA1-A complex subunit Abraxas 1 isoform X2 [Mustelus asterias]